MSNLARIKDKIAEGKPVIGSHVSLTDSVVSEIIGLAGFDFLWIDTEHSSIDKKDLLLHLISCREAGAAAFVRVPWNDPVLVKPVLEMGPDGIVFPFIRTAEDAKRAVSTCTYPPAGVRGFGPLRATKYGLIDTQQYIKESGDLIWKIMQIEHVEAVENLEEILAVEGVDSIVVGSNDLSGSIGLLGQTGHQEVKKLMDRIGETARKFTKPLGVSMGYNLEAIKEWISRGISWIGVGGDCGFLMTSARNTLENTNSLFSCQK